MGGGGGLTKVKALNIKNGSPVGSSMSLPSKLCPGGAMASASASRSTPLACSGSGGGSSTPVSSHEAAK